MSRPRYVSDLKLCLELLSRFEIYPDLEQLEHFLADEKHLELLNQCSLSIKTAWENSQDADLPTASLLEDWQPCSETHEPKAVELAVDSDADLNPPTSISLDPPPKKPRRSQNL